MAALRFLLSAGIMAGCALSAFAGTGAESSGGLPLSPAEGPDGAVYCVRADSLFAFSPDGVVRWIRRAPGEITAPPAVASDGTVYVLSRRETLSAIAPDGSTKWILDRMSGGMASIALGAEGTVYLAGYFEWLAISPEGVATGKKYPDFYTNASTATVGPDGTVLFWKSGSPFLFAMRPDGTFLWKHTLDEGAAAPPSLDYQGRLYVPAGARLVSLHPDGSLRWSVENGSGSRFTGAPVIAVDGTVCAADESGALSVISSDGQRVRTIPTGAATRTGPLLGSDGLLYQCALDGRLFRIDPLTGEVTLLPETGDQIQTPPIISSTGMICFGLAGGTLHTVHPSGLGGYAADAPWPCPDGNNRRSRNITVPSTLGAIAGTVRESSAGEPCIHVAIRVSPGDFRAVSDSTGRFRLSGLPEGVYRVTAEGFGIIPRTMEGVTVSRGVVSEVDLEVSRDRKWIRWTVTVRGGPGGTPAIGEDGTVYMGTASGLVYALDPDRTLRWCLQTEGSVTPVVIGYDRNLCFGSGNTLWSTDSEGNVRWKFSAGSSIFSPVTGRDGTVYFGCYDGNLYAVDSGGVLKWKTPVSGVYAPVLGMDGTIYAGLQDGVLLALDPYGQIKWSYPVEAAVVGSPILGPDGTIYVAAGQRLYALDPAGKLLWIYYLADSITCGPVMDADGKIYFGVRTDLYVISKLRLVWKYPLDAEITAIPAVGSDGIVYFGTAAGRFYALTFEGNLTWKLDAASIPRHGAALSPRGVLYFGTESGELFAIQTRSYGYQREASWPRCGKDNGNRASADPPPHAAALAGTVTDAGGGEGIPGITLRLIPGNITGMTDSRGRYTLFAPEPGVYRLEASASGWLPAEIPGISLVADGRRTVDVSLHTDAVSVKWKRYIQPYQFNRPFSAAPAIGSDGTVYLNAPGNLLAMSPEGSIQWKMSIGSSPPSSPTISSDGTIFMPGGSVLCSLSRTGAVNWSQSYPGAAGQFMTAALVADSILYVSNTDYYDRFVRAVWPSSGAQKWRTRSPYSTNPVFAPPVAGSDGTMYFGDSGTGFYAVSPGEKMQWMYATPYSVDAPSAIGPDNTLYIVQRSGALSAIDPSGKLRWTFQGGYEALGSCIVGPDSTAYYVDGQGILSALDSDGTVTWSRTGLLPCAVPALGSDRTLYVAGKEGKLLALNSEGQQKWSFDLGSDVEYAPKLAPDGTLYLYCANGYLYALRTSSRGYPRERCWPCLFGNNRNTGHLAPESDRGSITGVVTDKETGSAVADALITLSPGGRTAVTDAGGRFTLPDLKRGGYTLAVSAAGYRARDDLWTEIIGGGTIDLELSLAEVETGIREPDAPRTVTLFPNYPNPFNPSTTIRFTLPESGAVTVQAYNAAGQKVDDIFRGVLPKGERSLTWTPPTLSAGVYFVRVGTPFGARSIKAILLK